MLDILNCFFLACYQFIIHPLFPIQAPIYNPLFSQSQTGLSILKCCEPEIELYFGNIVSKNLYFVLCETKPSSRFGGVFVLKLRLSPAELNLEAGLVWHTVSPVIVGHDVR